MEMVLGTLLVALATWVVWALRAWLANGGRPTTSASLMPRVPEHWLLGHAKIVGEAMALGDNLHDIQARMMTQLGRPPLMLLNLPPVMRMTVTGNPSIIKEALLTKNLSKSPTYKWLTPLMGESSMLSTPHDRWVVQRRAFAPAFTPAFLRSMVPMFIEKTQVFLSKLDRARESGEAVCVYPAATLLTADVIATAVFGKSWGLQDADAKPELMCAFEAVMNHIQYWYGNSHLAWMQKLPWVKARSRRLQAHLDGLLRPAITEGIAELERARTAAAAAAAPAGAGEAAAAAATPLVHAPVNILACALEAARVQGSTLDTEDLLSQTKTFLFAGHDTTASLIAWSIYALTQHREAEAKLLAEMEAAGAGAPDAPLTADLLTSLPFMNAVIRETLRMWPPASTARWVPPGETLGGYSAGGTVFYPSTQLAHHDPDIWGPNAGEFRPERWLDSAAVAALQPCAYLPFSKGPRDCIGQHFAVLEAKLVLALALRRFRFEYAGERPEEVVMIVTDKPKHGCKMRVFAR